MAKIKFIYTLTGVYKTHWPFQYILNNTLLCSCVYVMSEADFIDHLIKKLAILPVKYLLILVSKRVQMFQTHLRSGLT